MAPLRVFNRFGIRFFRFHLCEMRKCGAELDRSLLHDPELTEPFPLGEVELEHHAFANRKEWAEYLDGVFLAAGIETTVDMPGLWEWLSLFYWDQVCKRNEDGTWDLRDDEKYVLGEGNRDHRHLLRDPYLLFRQYQLVPDADADVVLCQPLEEIGDVVENITARGRIRSSGSAMRLAGDLFLDRDAGELRSPIRRDDGGLRDFCKWLQELPPQFNLNSIDYRTLLLMLPTRFNTLLSCGPGWAEAQRIRTELLDSDVIADDDDPFLAEPLRMEGVLRHLNLRRRGNDADVSPVLSDLFAAGTIASYDYRCAVSGLGLGYSVHTDAPIYEVQAAHIVPLASGGLDSIRNGLTLSRTIRWAFDQGLIWIDVVNEHRVVVADEVRNERRNAWLRQFEGRSLTLPSSVQLRPDPERLDWHAAHVARR